MTIDNNGIPLIKYNLTIKQVNANDAGNYTCEQYGPIDGEQQPIKKQFNILALQLPRIIAKSSARIETKISQSVSLFCLIEAHPITDFVKAIKWIKDDGENTNTIHKKPNSNSQAPKDIQALIANRTTIHHLSKESVNVTLDLTNIFKRDNGSYSCVAEIPSDFDEDVVFEKFHPILATSSVFVLDVPQVSLDL